MTTYDAIECLIKRKVFPSYNAAMDVIFEAYNTNKINRWEYLELGELAKKYLPDVK